MLFLFPVGLVTIRHWSSVFFVLLSLLAVVFFKRNISLIRLETDEKMVVLLVGLFFFSFLLSSYMNGWDRSYLRYVEDEIRFLLFVPLYFLVRRTGGALEHLVKGSALGIFVTFGVAFHEVHILGVDRATGAYSPLLLGPVVSVMVFVVVNGFRSTGDSPLWKSLSLISVPLGIYAAYLSLSRSAYVLIATLSIITILFQLDGKRLKLSVSTLLAIALLFTYQYAPKVTYSVHRVASALSEVLDVENIASLNMDEPGTSTKERIALLHVSYEIFADNMLFGVGRGEYSSVIQGYIDSGRANPVVAIHSHPHNIFAESMVSRGIIGLSLLLSLFVYLIYLILVHVRRGSYAVRGLMIVVGSFLIAGMFEASLMIKGNYIAFVLVYLASTLSETIRESKTERAIKKSEK